MLLEFVRVHKMEGIRRLVIVRISEDQLARDSKRVDAFRDPVEKFALPIMEAFMPEERFQQATRAPHRHRSRHRCGLCRGRCPPRRFWPPGSGGQGSRTRLRRLGAEAAFIQADVRRDDEVKQPGRQDRHRPSVPALF